MAFVHGKNTVITVNAVDLSAFTNTSEFERSADTHDTTTYGKNDHVYSGGLGDGKFTMSGVYDDGATGPRDTLEPLIGTSTTVIYKPEGTGSGKPQDSFSAILEKFNHSAPVADMVAWSAEFQVSDAVTSTNQA